MFKTLIQKRNWGEIIDLKGDGNKWEIIDIMKDCGHDLYLMSNDKNQKVICDENLSIIMENVKNGFSELYE